MPTFLRRMLYFVVVIVPTLSACERTPTEVKHLAGEYRLTAINGVALPISIPTNMGESGRVFKGTLQLQRDGKYLQVIHYSFSEGASNPHDTGTFQVQGRNVRFASVDRPAYIGSLGESQLIISFDLLDTDPGPEQLTFTRN